MATRLATPLAALILLLAGHSPMLAQDRTTLTAALEARDADAAGKSFRQLVQEAPPDLADLLMEHAEQLASLGLEADLARAVTALPPPGVERVLQALRAEEVSLERRAALTFALAGVKGPAATQAQELAAAALASDDPRLATAGARAAGKLGGAAVIDRLVARLEQAQQRAELVNVALEAQQALVQLTGQTLSGAAAWRGYFAGQEERPHIPDASHGPSTLGMVILGLIMLATYGVIAFELAPKSLAAIAGAGAATIAGLALGLFHTTPGESAYKYVHHVIGHDLGVLGVIVGTSILVEVASRSGLFHFFAVKIVKKTGGDPHRLFLVTGLMTMLFVTFLTIAPGSLIAISLILVVTKALDYPAKPYLVFIAIAANSGALVTFASGVCTLMLGTAGKLAYVDFFRASTPMALVSGAVAYLVLRWFYGRELAVAVDPEVRRRTIEGFDEWAVVKDRKVFYRMGAILLATIGGFASAQSLGVGLDFVAFMGATAAVIFSGESADEAIKKVNWPVIIFFVGLFVVIGSVQASGLLDMLAGGIMNVSGGAILPTLLLVAAFVLVLSGVVDNIPVAATMIPIVKALGDQGFPAEPLWWVLVLSCNLGGNSTPVGSISTILAMSALEKERGVKITWGEFLKVGGTVFLLQSALVFLYVIVYHRFDLFPGT